MIVLLATTSRLMYSWNLKSWPSCNFQREREREITKNGSFWGPNLRDSFWSVKVTKKSCCARIWLATAGDSFLPRHSSTNCKFLVLIQKLVHHTSSHKRRLVHALLLEYSHQPLNCKAGSATRVLFFLFFVFFLKKTARILSLNVWAFVLTSVVCFGFQSYLC